MEFKLHVNLDNAAFNDEFTGEPAQGYELARILRSLADYVENFYPDTLDGFERNILDVNGNRVGRAETVED